MDFSRINFDSTVTVITVCLNAERTLQRTLESISCQTYSQIEFILCDGGSTDKTIEVYQSWHSNIQQNVDLLSKFTSIQLIHQKSVGIYAAMNEASLIASGEVITFLHANDAFFHSRVCELAMLALKKNTSTEAVYGNVFVESSNLLERRYIVSRRWRPWMLQWGFMSPQPGSFFRISALRRVGFFLETMQIGSDYEWLLRFHYMHGFVSKWVEGIQVNMLTGGVSMQGCNSRKVITNEMKQSLRRHGFQIKSWQLWLRLPFKSLGVIRSICYK